MGCKRNNVTVLDDLLHAVWGLICRGFLFKGIDKNSSMASYKIMITARHRYDVSKLQKNYEEKIECFRNRYFELVKKAQKLFYGEDQNKKKKYQTLPSSAYYNIGKLLQKFNDEVKNEFKIINYTSKHFQEILG